MEKEKSVKKGFVNKFLDFIEVGGNKLPHPVTLFFFILCSYYFDFWNSSKNRIISYL